MHLFGRLPHNLLTLITRPGGLTRTWIDGDRSARLPPVLLYATLGITALLITLLFSTSNEAGYGRTDERAVASSFDLTASTPGTLDPMSAQADSAREATRLRMRSFAFGQRPALRLADRAVAHLMRDAWRDISARLLLLSLPLLTLLLMVFSIRRPTVGVAAHFVHALDFHAWLFMLFGVWWLAMFLPVMPAQVVTFALLVWVVSYLFISTRRVYGTSAIVAALFSVCVAVVYFALASVSAPWAHERIAAADAGVYEFQSALWNEARIIQSEALRDSAGVAYRADRAGVAGRAGVADRAGGADAVALAKRALHDHAWLMIRTDPDYDLHTALLQLEAGDTTAALASAQRYRWYFQENVNGNALECRIDIARGDAAAARDVCGTLVRFMAGKRATLRTQDPDFVLALRDARTWIAADSAARRK